jgi:hypothetical protein
MIYEITQQCFGASKQLVALFPGHGCGIRETAKISSSVNAKGKTVSPFS